MKTPVQQLAIYTKALELYTLSRKLTEYLTHDKELNSLYHSEDSDERDLEYMVVESLGLAPGIVMAEITKEVNKRTYYINKLSTSIRNLRKRVQSIRSLNHRDRDYVNLFKRELQQFNMLLEQWSLSLLHKN